MAEPLLTVWWAIGDAPGVVESYEAQALVYTLAGLANQAHAAGPALLIDNGALDIDDAYSDEQWKNYFESTGRASFEQLHDPSLCSLVKAFHASGTFRGATRYASDGFSVYPAMTLAGLTGALPVSEALASNYQCLAELPMRHDLTAHRWPSKLHAFRWAIDELLPNCSRAVTWNGDYYRDMVPVQGKATLMSVDYAVAVGAFVMDLTVLWTCDPIDCGTTGSRVATPHETAMFVEIVGQLDEQVAVMGWGDPEHVRPNTCEAFRPHVTHTILQPPSILLVLAPSLGSSSLGRRTRMSLAPPAALSSVPSPHPILHTGIGLVHTGVRRPSHYHTMTMGGLLRTRPT